MATAGTNVCSKCGYSVQRSGSDEIKSCPQCGNESWTKSVAVQDSLRVYEELGLAARDKVGEIVAERIQKTELNTSANLSADRDNPSRICVDRKRRVAGFEE